MTISEEMLNKIIVVGDRVFIKPKTPSKTTKLGLFLLPNFRKKKEMLLGLFIKVNSGFSIVDNELWEVELLKMTFHIAPKPEKLFVIREEV
jgi:hypothetical protein